MNIKWNTKKYTEDFDFVHKYGEGVMDLLDINEGDCVIDLGCGNGALTEKLHNLGAEVIGIDGSADMIERAKELHPAINFVCDDAVTFSVEKKADCVFSNAVFHWIDECKQEEMLKNIARAIKVGGQLVCEFGGSGCCEKIHSALEKEFNSRGLEYKRTFYFPKIGEYTSIIDKCGFKTVYAVLFDRKTELKGESGMEDWIRMFVKIPFEGIYKAVCDEIIDSTVSKLRNDMYENGKWYADYVRIRIKAVKE
ncbi:MAG: class I SAM-dependent methyltransferase [Hominilimicola sp.]